MADSLVGFIGVIVGAFITYIGEWWFRRDRKIKHHKASLIKIQFSLCHIMNEVTLIKRKYTPHKKNERRGILPPAFGTPVKWVLDRDLVFEIYYKGEKTEKELIHECAFLDKQFRGLIGAIEDKMKYYEIDKYKMKGNDIPELFLNHLNALTDSIYKRATELDIECLFKKLKIYIDLRYPRLAIDYSLKI